MEQLDIVVDAGTGKAIVKGQALQPVMVQLIFDDGVARVVLAVQATPRVEVDADTVRRLTEACATLEAMNEPHEWVTVREVAKAMRELLPDFEKIGEPIGECYAVPPLVLSEETAQKIMRVWHDDVVKAWKNKTGPIACEYYLHRDGKMLSAVAGVSPMVSEWTEKELDDRPDHFEVIFVRDTAVPPAVVDLNKLWDRAKESTPREDYYRLLNRINDSTDRQFGDKVPPQLACDRQDAEMSYPTMPAGAVKHETPGLSSYYTYRGWLYEYHADYLKWMRRHKLATGGVVKGPAPVMASNDYIIHGIDRAAAPDTGKLYVATKDQIGAQVRAVDDSTAMTYAKMPDDAISHRNRNGCTVYSYGGWGYEWQPDQGLWVRRYPLPAMVDDPALVIDQRRLDNPTMPHPKTLLEAASEDKPMSLGLRLKRMIGTDGYAAPHEQHPEGLEPGSEAEKRVQAGMHDAGTSRLEKALEGVPVAGCPDCGSTEHDNCRS